MSKNNGNGQGVQTMGIQGQPQPSVGVPVQPAQAQPQVMQSGINPTVPPAATKPVSVKVHKTFGEYKKCIIHPTKHAQGSTSVFISVNRFVYEAQPEIEIELPIGIINFLKNASVAEHYYDRTATSVNGNKGEHRTRYPKKYIVEIL